MQNLTPLTSVSDVQRIEKFVRGLLKRGPIVLGVPGTGPTIEVPVSGEFVVPPWSLALLVDNLAPLVVPNARMGDPSYAALEDDVLNVCGGDNLVRRDAVSFSNFYGYHHFMHRDGALFHVVHARELEFTDFIQHFQTIFKLERAVVRAHFPKADALSRVQLRWSVDALWSAVEKSVLPEPAGKEG